MIKNYRTIISLLLLALSVTISANPIVDMQTNLGTITIELNADEAPKTVANFLRYVDTGFYDNTLFHRAVNRFLIQGGGFDTDFNIKETFSPIALESNNGLKNQRGTIAMARKNTPNSAASQFFINSEDNNNFFDYQSSIYPGYAVFGFVTEGMDVVDEISAVETSSKNSFDGKLYHDVPVKPIIVEAIRRREGQLSFKGVKATYSMGDVINISLEESDITRESILDLWVAILLPNGEFLFLTQEGDAFFTSTATPFKHDVAIEENSFQILNFIVPEGLVGHYSLFAIFNDPGSDINNLTYSLRSNIANVEIDLVN